MRLTLVNFVTKRTEPRFLYRGKYRMVKKVKLPALNERYVDLQREEKNMLVLRHPYLTVAQSRGHMAEFKDPRAFRRTCDEHTLGRFNKKFTWAEQLSHLRVKDAWD